MNDFRNNVSYKLKLRRLWSLSSRRNSNSTTIDRAYVKHVDKMYHSKMNEIYFLNYGIYKLKLITKCTVNLHVNWEQIFAIIYKLKYYI